MPRQQDIRYQQDQLQLHRSNLQEALKQRALQGGRIFERPDIQVRIDEARSGIARCKDALLEWAQPVEDLPDDLPSADNPFAVARPTSEVTQRTERANQHLISVLIAVTAIAVVGLAWLSTQQHATPESAGSTDWSKARVSAPPPSLPTFDPQQAEAAAVTSSPSDQLFASVLPSPTASLKMYDPAEEVVTSVIPTPEPSTQAKIVPTPQPTVQPTAPVVAEAAAPTVWPTPPLTELTVPANVNPAAGASSVCGSTSSDKASFVDTFSDGSLDNEQRKVVRDSRVDVGVENGYLRFIPREKIDESTPALFYRTKVPLKNFCSIVFFSNFTGEKGSVSLSFRYTESEQIKYKFYSFWVSTVGYTENRYYIQSASPGHWDFVQNKEGPLPESFRYIRTIAVRCYDIECSFFVNDVKITDVIGGIDEEAGEIRFYMKGDIQFDVHRIEVYEL